jgi:phage-related protein
MDISIIENANLPVAASFGGTASFSSLVDSVVLNDSYSQRSLKGINSLNMSLDLSFNQLTDEETRKTISFLQKNFYYTPQEYHIYGVFTNKRIEPFNYTPFYPYKPNQFFCLSYAHHMESKNVNNVTASFTCAYPSILNNNEPPASGYGSISSNFSTFLFRGPAISYDSGATLSLKKDNYIYLNGGYKNFKLNSDQNPSTISLEQSTARLDINSSIYNFSQANSCRSQHSTLRNSIFIENPNECSYYPYNPKTESGELDFRMFDFRPTEGVKISHSPKYKTSSVTDFYQKFNKYGYNHNLSNLSLSFNGRSDLEAKRILFFLESHLGYKKFCFHFHHLYRGNEANTGGSPHHKKVSTFYCPEWTHTFTYHNNHNISATFIECV